RLMVLTFWGHERFSSPELAPEARSVAIEHAHSGPRESPLSMVTALIVLAIGAVFAGYLGVASGLSDARIPNYFEEFLRPSLAPSPPESVTHDLPLRDLAASPRPAHTSSIP